jgi:hypothetical protein
LMMFLLERPRAAHQAQAHAASHAAAGSHAQSGCPASTFRPTFRHRLLPIMPVCFIPTPAGRHTARCRPKVLPPPSPSAPRATTTAEQRPVAGSCSAAETPPPTAPPPHRHTGGLRTDGSVTNMWQCDILVGGFLAGYIRRRRATVSLEGCG